ncbi:MAG: hypothetical protein GKR93_16670 [Gammaproteobacteria bacterium]|nr:hypothetical protein [Gammaproteobacteria bacterium]
MNIAKLILVWVTPAFLAGIMGWRGIWGGSNAFFDYIIPIPVAGGVFHVPSFVIAAAIIVGVSKTSGSRAFYIFILALGVAIGAQTLQLDFERLNNWLFTDYVPARSPFRFNDNPLLLFVFCDALWVAFFALRATSERNWRKLVLLPLIPLSIIGAEAILYRSAGTIFKPGLSRPVTPRGSEVAMVYTNSAYDESVFRSWLEEKNSMRMPWQTPNAEHVAVHFTTSMQDIKWGKIEKTDNIIATFCFYETDMSSSAHSGYYDCFTGKKTLSQRRRESAKETKTGLGREIDRWYSDARLCDGVDLSGEINLDIEIVSLCRGLSRGYARKLEQTASRDGENSEQLVFLKEKASLLGLVPEY